MTNTYFLSYLTHFFLEWQMLQTKVLENIKNTHFMLNNLFQKSCHLRDNGEKVCRTRQAADNNMAHAHCMLDT